MKWQFLVDFIARRDPEFPRRIRGAAPREIAALERRHGVGLPRAYEGFLLTFGKDAGGFELSSERYTDIQALLEVASEPRVSDRRPSYPQSRFLWIGGQVNVSDESYWGDPYLDLERGDRDDPPSSRMSSRSRTTPRSCRMN